MDKNELSQLTDDELLKEAKKIKSASITHAVLIGFMIGIIIYSILVSSVGFFTLIPVFLIYLFINSSKDYKALKEVLKERNLK